MELDSSTPGGEVPLLGYTFDSNAASSRRLTTERTYSSSVAALEEVAGGDEVRLNKLVIFTAFIVVLSGVANRVAYKIMLVPLEQFPYLVSQISSVLYVLLFMPLFIHAARRDNLGFFEPLKRHWRLLAMMGACDGLGDVLGLVANRKLPGTVVTLLPKVIIPMTMFASFLILKIRYSCGEMLGAFLVVGGALVALIPLLTGHSASPVPSTNSESQGTEVFSAILLLISVAPSALSFVLKELVFARDPKLTVFAISFWGSCFQLFVALLLLPLSAVPDFGKVPLAELPTYAADGLSCWAGSAVPARNATCEGDPLAPIAYHSFNLTFNVALIVLLKLSGATLMFLASTLTFPVTNLMFAISWPLLGADPSAVSLYNILGLVIELIGVTAYRVYMGRREAKQRTLNLKSLPELEDAWNSDTA